jgi:hypothetical protein
MSYSAEINLWYELDNPRRRYCGCCALPGFHWMAGIRFQALRAPRSCGTGGGGRGGGRTGSVSWQGISEPRVDGQLRGSGFSLVLIAIIRNDGRQAVTVGMCEWRANTVGTAGTLAGDPFPRQLEAGASCKVAFDLLALLLMLRQSGAVSKERKRGISAVVHLGTGGRVRSKPLKIPLEARQASRLRTIR